METITVMLRERSYPIIIDENLFNDPLSFCSLKAGDKAMLVTNQTLAPLYYPQIKASIEKVGVKLDMLSLPDGEQYKSLVMFEKIITALLENNHGRDTTLIALGGGVIGDLVGYTAASYQRGVRFIQVPTSLLAQVDSSVGGKTAVNHPLGKNMIGAFYQPSSVIIDINCLKTLPERELSSGLAEVIKYGMIFDPDFFNWLEEHIDAIRRLEPEAIMYCIRCCCELKAKIVALDECEHGKRALLNLGHTFGHAIETGMGYGNWLHGEAVAVGMLMAAKTAEKMGLFASADILRLKNLLVRAHLPVVKPVEMQPDDYLIHMMRDKKVAQGVLHFVLPTKIGHAEVRSGVPNEVILSAIKES